MYKLEECIEKRIGQRTKPRGTPQCIPVVADLSNNNTETPVFKVGPKPLQQLIPTQVKKDIMVNGIKSFA